MWHYLKKWGSSILLNIGAVLVLLLVLLVGIILAQFLVILVVMTMTLIVNPFIGEWLSQFFT